MKFTISIILASILASSAVAAEQRYNIKSMDCAGKINEQPKGMHESYVHMGLRLIQFKSKRKDGTFADSLGWNTFYGKTHAEVIQQMTTQKYGGETWYTGLLFKRQLNGKTYIVSKDEYASRFTGVVYPNSYNGHREYVQARYGRRNTVVGNYYYDLNCRLYR